jgi:hypothetical protein
MKRKSIIITGYLILAVTVVATLVDNVDYYGGNPIGSKFHWTDILIHIQIYIPIRGSIPAIFY